MSIKTIFDNKWLSLKEIKEPEQGINGYIFSHETRCNGKIISMLPYRNTTQGIKFLLRKEITPSWSLDYNISTITGGVEKYSPLETAKHELLEEAGYDIDIKNIIELGTIRAGKSNDTVYYLYSMDLTGKKPEKAKGDGSELETNASCIWDNDLNKCVDSLAYAIFYKLKGKIK
jgi:hypothetical protein